MWCLIRGREFSPGAATRMTGLWFDESNEPGELVRTGAYKGKPLPYGSGVLEEKHPSIGNGFGERVMGSITGKIPLLKSTGAESIALYLEVYHDGSCLFEIPVELLSKLASVGLPLQVSCYEEA